MGIIMTSNTVDSKKRLSMMLHVLNVILFTAKSYNNISFNMSQCIILALSTCSM